MAENSRLDWKALLIGAGTLVIWFFLLSRFSFILGSINEIEQSLSGERWYQGLIEIIVWLIPGPIIAGYLGIPSLRLGAIHGILAAFLGTLIVYSGWITILSTSTEIFDMIRTITFTIFILSPGILAFGAIGGVIGAAAKILLQKSRT